jgi:hypothetical protein
MISPHRRRPPAGLAAAVLVASATALSTPACRGQDGGSPAVGDPFNVERWREDYTFLRKRSRPLTAYERLKYLPLDAAGTVYLTLGGELRERVESYDRAFFGLRGGASFTAFATRLLADADLHLGPRCRAFVELGSFVETGRKPAERPFDRGDLELQQGFVDLVVADAPEERLVLRLGRQELPLGSGRLVSIREATNVRLGFDAVTATWTSGGRTLEALAGRPVQPELGVFESAPTGGESFWGLDWTVPGALAAAADLELFYFGRDLHGAAFARGVADETRHTLGGRVWTRRQRWDASVQASYQAGSFGDAPIGAWGVATETGFAFAGAPLRPRLALRADVASGDRSPRDHTLGTFEAPYPALNYFSEASIVAPANAYDLHPYLELRPRQDLSAELGVDFLWRLRRGDAYRAGGGFLVPAAAGAGDASFVTAMTQLEVNWRPSPFFAVQAADVYAAAGDLIRDVHGVDASLVLLSVDLRF